MKALVPSACAPSPFTVWSARTGEDERGRPTRIHDRTDLLYSSLLVYRSIRRWAFVLFLWYALKTGLLVFVLWMSLVLAILEESLYFRLWAVSWLRRLAAGLSLWRSGFVPGSVHVGFMVDNVALGQVFSLFFTFPLSLSFRRGCILIYCYKYLRKYVMMVTSFYDVGGRFWRHCDWTD
jgi:hypothetical protein